MSEKQLVIRIREGGAVESLHAEGTGLERLGRCRVRRASNVEFDEDRQEWVAEDAVTGNEIHASTSRGECLEAERRHFNRQLQNGRQPFSEESSA